MKLKVGDEIPVKGTTRLRMGESIRFCCLDDEIEAARMHVIQGKYRICLAEMGKPCPMCGEDEPRLRMAMNILVYGTQGIEFRVWTFGPDKYRMLRQVRTMVPDIAKHDLVMQCVNESFQQVSMQVMHEAEWTSGKYGPPEQIIASFHEKKKDLVKVLRQRGGAEFGMEGQVSAPGVFFGPAATGAFAPPPTQQAIPPAPLVQQPGPQMPPAASPQPEPAAALDRMLNEL